MSTVPRIVVVFAWDEEAGVYVAHSDDVPLTTEAQTYEELRAKVLQMVPEVLALNNLLPEPDDGPPEVPVELLSRHQVRTACA